MTQFVIQGADGFYLSRNGWTNSVRRARTFDSYTEAEICILSNSLEPARVEPVSTEEPSYQAPEAAR